jgi:hypothetical protein
MAVRTFFAGDSSMSVHNPKEKKPKSANLEVQAAWE